jgi:hypothetical protein
LIVIPTKIPSVEVTRAKQLPKKIEIFRRKSKFPKEWQVDCCTLCIFLSVCLFSYSTEFREISLLKYKQPSLLAAVHLFAEKKSESSWKIIRKSKN